VIFLTLVLLLAEARLELRAGAASRPITPPIGTPLGGYAARQGRPSASVHDELYARAVVLEQAGRRFALVSCDLVGITRDVRARAADLLAPLGIGPADLLLAATHTHSGSGALARDRLAEVVMGKFDPNLLDFTLDAVAEAVAVAATRLEPVTLKTASGAAPGFACNRRRPEGPCDPTIGILSLERYRGAPVAWLVSFGAHPTLLGPDNLAISRDWPGPLVDCLKRFSGADEALFLNAAAGDQRPCAREETEAFARVEAFGAALAERFAEVASHLYELPTSAFGTRYTELPVTAPGAALFERATALVQTVALGSVVLLALPGEVSCELGLAFRQGAKSLGFTNAYIVSLANDHLGYLLSPEDYAKGGYEAKMAFFGPDAGIQTIAAGLEQAAILAREAGLL
jgi:hypothetical protein